ncbi:MAG: creatininase family protein [Kiloniellales bacterium]
MRSGYWQDLTTEDFAALDAERCVALLPVAAIEQHGPPLPLSTDATINAGIVRRTLDKLPDEVTLLVLPAQTVGDSAEHSDFPGTLSAASETLIALWSELGAWVARAGLRKLVIFNSHGGQTQIVDIVALRLRMEHEMMVVRANSFRFGVPPGLFDEREVKQGIHGGAVETALMLHLAPELVRREAIRDFPPLAREMEQSFSLLSPQGPGAFAWASQDLNPAGVCGDATAASADKGAGLLEHISDGLVTLVEELQRAPLSLLRGKP